MGGGRLSRWLAACAKDCHDVRYLLTFPMNENENDSLIIGYDKRNLLSATVRLQLHSATLLLVKTSLIRSEVFSISVPCTSGQ